MMTYSEIITTLNNLSDDYRNYANAARNPGYSYSERVYYLGLAIHSLQLIAEVCHRYPAIATRANRIVIMACLFIYYFFLK